MRRMRECAYVLHQLVSDRTESKLPQLLATFLVGTSRLPRYQKCTRTMTSHTMLTIGETRKRTESVKHWEQCCNREGGERGYFESAELQPTAKQTEIIARSVHICCPLTQGVRTLKKFVYQMEYSVGSRSCRACPLIQLDSALALRYAR